MLKGHTLTLRNKSQPIPGMYSDQNAIAKQEHHDQVNQAPTKAAILQDTRRQD